MIPSIDLNTYLWLVCVLFVPDQTDTEQGSHWQDSAGEFVVVAMLEWKLMNFDVYHCHCDRKAVVAMASTEEEDCLDTAMDDTLA